MATRGSGVFNFYYRKRPEPSIDYFGYYAVLQA
jgi:hypothetical protein